MWTSSMWKDITLHWLLIKPPSDPNTTPDEIRHRSIANHCCWVLWQARRWAATDAKAKLYDNAMHQTADGKHEWKLLKRLQLLLPFRLDSTVYYTSYTQHCYINLHPKSTRRTCASGWSGRRFVNSTSRASPRRVTRWRHCSAKLQKSKQPHMNSCSVSLCKCDDAIHGTAEQTIYRYWGDISRYNSLDHGSWNRHPPHRPSAVKYLRAMVIITQSLTVI